MLFLSTRQRPETRQAFFLATGPRWLCLCSLVGRQGPQAGEAIVTSSMQIAMSRRAPPPPKRARRATRVMPRSTPKRVQARLVATWETSPDNLEVRHDRHESSVVVVDSFSHLVVVCLTTQYRVESRLIYNLRDPVISPIEYVYAVVHPPAFMSERAESGFDSRAGISLFGQCMLAQPGPPVRGPLSTHAALAAMQPCRIVIRPALPQKSKLFRHPDSLLAWAVHPLNGKACLRTQSTSLPPLHACMQPSHSRGWKNTGTKPKH